jgi:hypothetical protein
MNPGDYRSGCQFVHWGAFEEEVRGGRTRNQHAKKKLGVGIDQPSKPNMKGYFCSHYAI